ncbi:hypothetical protein, partial [Novacetimonas hansenii]|uniref:hypothetical protein n=1 Tax=Novacetimonas hansenii TaxID=436 RepID=UPI0039EB3404
MAPFCKQAAPGNIRHAHVAQAGCRIGDFLRNNIASIMKNIKLYFHKRLFENNYLIKKQEKFLGAAFFQKGGVF